LSSSSVEVLTVGTKVGEVSYTVSAADVAQYAAVMGFESPVPVPPDFVAKHCMHELFDSAFDAMGPNIRAKQAFDFFAPVEVGDELHAVGYVVDRYERRGKWFITLEGLYTNEQGDLVLRDRRTQLKLPDAFDIDAGKES